MPYDSAYLSTLSMSTNSKRLTASMFLGVGVKESESGLALLRGAETTSLRTSAVSRHSHTASCVTYSSNRVECPSLDTEDAQIALDGAVGFSKALHSSYQVSSISQ